MSGSGAEARYRIGALLGAGGMAEVYLAEDAVLGRRVAVKCLRGEHVGDPEWTERFRGEAQILAALEHPGAIPVYDAGQLAGGRDYYAMKRIRGETLGCLLGQRGEAGVRDPSALVRWLDVFERVCDTVAAAHAAGVVHRDLKPDNVMVDQFGAVYVVDWGLARHLEAAPGAPDGPGRILGTPGYLAPEQARGAGEDSGTQADVFALGCILYEILTGQPAFPGDTQRALLKGVLYHDPAEPRKANPLVARALSAICQKALAKDPYRRYPSAAELGADLRCYREHRPVSARPPGVGERLRNWGRRRPALAASCTTLAAALLIGGGGLLSNAALETHMTGEVYDWIDSLDRQAGQLGRELASVRGALEDGGQTPGERRALEQRAAGLAEGVEIREELIRSMTMGVVAISRFAPEGPARQLLREHFWAYCEELLGRARYAAALALLDFALESYAGANLFNVSEAEHARLLAQRARVAELAARAEGAE